MGGNYPNSVRNSPRQSVNAEAIEFLEILKNYFSKNKKKIYI